MDYIADMDWTRTKISKGRTLLWMTVQTPPFPSLCSSTSDILTFKDISEEWINCKYQRNKTKHGVLNLLSLKHTENQTKAT